MALGEVVVVGAQLRGGGVGRAAPRTGGDAGGGERRLGMAVVSQPNLHLGKTEVGNGEGIVGLVEVQQILWLQISMYYPTSVHMR